MNMQYYSTTDFQITVVLSAMGYKLAAIDKSQPRFVFNFENDSQIPDCIAKLYQGKLNLDPRLILMHSKMVKDRIHGGGF